LPERVRAGKSLFCPTKHREERHMKLALNENTIPQTDLIDFISLAGEVGFTAVELSIRKVEAALLCYPARKVVELLHDLGVSVLSVNCFNPYYAPVENRKYLKTLSECIATLCECIECPNILIPAGIWINSLKEKPSWRASYDLQKENLLFMAGILSIRELVLRSNLWEVIISLLRN